jgi:hypothetical protein
MARCPFEPRPIPSEFRSRAASTWSWSSTSATVRYGGRNPSKDRPFPAQNYDGSETTAPVEAS